MKSTLMQASLFNIVTDGKDEWLTPPEIIKALGEFDLDPCSPILRPWPTAKRHFTIEDNGLVQIWDGRVWLNPPYGNACQLWMERMSKHGNGIALIFARTETQFFQKYVFDIADSILFLKGRLSFYNIDGTKGKSNGGAPSCLVAYGQNNSQAISQSKIEGKHLAVNSVPIIVVGISPSWRSVVEICLSEKKKPILSNL